MKIRGPFSLRSAADLTASPSSPSPPPGGRPGKMTGFPPGAVRAGKASAPMTRPPSARATKDPFLPSRRASHGSSPPRRRARSARTRDRSPLPAGPRRTVSSQGASRSTGRSNRRTRAAGSGGSPDREGRGGYEARSGSDPRRQAVRPAPLPGCGSWPRSRPRIRSPAAPSPPPVPRYAARWGAPSPRGAAPCGW